MKHIAIIFCALALLASSAGLYKAYQVRDQAYLLKTGLACTTA